MNRERVKIAQDVAAAIAHEMRNPVFGIASAAQLLRYRVGDDPLMEKNVGRIIRDAERLNSLIAALLEYGRPAPVQLEPVDPDAVWTDVIARHRGLLESKALLVQHTAAEPRAQCNIDVEQFAQACSNALVNAVEAATEGTDLTVTSMLVENGAWQSRLRNDGAPVSVELSSYAFAPLVTTKSGHSGLGLAIAHRVIADHGGTIALERVEGAGTMLTLTLPAARCG
jgi:signal transduction histidine kinase